jgi:hypothetical protein
MCWQKWWQRKETGGNSELGKGGVIIHTYDLSSSGSVDEKSSKTHFKKGGKWEAPSGKCVDPWVFGIHIYSKEVFFVFPTFRNGDSERVVLSGGKELRVKSREDNELTQHILLKLLGVPYFIRPHMLFSTSPVDISPDGEVVVSKDIMMNSSWSLM